MSLKVDGQNGQIELHEDKVVIHKKGFLVKKSNTELLFTQIKRLQYIEPSSIFKPGLIRFVTDSSEDISPTNADSDPNTLSFDKTQKKKIDELKNRVLEKLENTNERVNVYKDSLSSDRPAVESKENPIEKESLDFQSCLGCLGLIIIIFLIGSCFFSSDNKEMAQESSSKQVTQNQEEKEAPAPTPDEDQMENLKAAMENKQTAISQTKTHVQRKIPKSNVIVDMSTNEEDLVVMVDIKMTSNDVNEAKSLAKQYLEALADVPASVVRYDFTFLYKGKMVCMITKQKGVDKLSVFADGKTSKY